MLTSLKYLFALVALALLGPGLHAQPAAAPRIGEAAVPCPFDTAKAQLAVECGRLTVPENYDSPGRTIELAFMIVRARDNRDPDHPVLYLSGGPGSASLVFAELLVANPQVHDVVVDRDWVFLDQRGLGRSLPALRCPRDDSDWLTRVRNCRDKFVGEGVDLAQYSSTRSARDIEELRKALGVAQWNLWGSSYGSRLAFYVARDFPASVRSIVHDGPSYVEGPEIIDDFRGTDVAIHRLLSKCAADAACAARYPDLRARFLAALPRLRQQPLAVGDEQIDDNALAQYLRGYLFGSDPALYEANIRALVAQMDAAARGDGAEILRIRRAMPQEVDPYDANPIPAEGFYSMAENLSVECNEERPFETLAAYQAAAAGSEIVRALFGRDGGAAILEDCALWPAGRADPVSKTRVDYDGPQLAFTGELDASLSGLSGFTIAMLYPHARNVVFRNAGHVQVPLAYWPPAVVDPYRLCALRLARAFFADPRARLDTGCAESRPFRLVE